MEQDDFKSRLSTVLDLVNGKLLLLSNDISEGRFVKVKLDQDDSKTDEEKQKEKDHCLIQMLNLIDKITVHCPGCLTSKKYLTEFDEIAQQCQVFLAYPHTWVRLKAAKIIGTILSTIDPQGLDLIVREKVESERGFIYYDTESSLKSLVLDLCAQYTPGVSKEMADQVILFVSYTVLHSIDCVSDLFFPYVWTDKKSCCRYTGLVLT